MQLDSSSKLIRKKAFELSRANGGYHYGGSFSCAEILYVLYYSIHKPALGDVFILSKGHGCWVYYALLCERGFQPRLEGHPHRDLKEGVYWTTGSEGHGLPVAIGVALAKKKKGQGGKVVVLMGDGECQEGTTWESLLLASHLCLDNLTIIVDCNEIQGSGRVKEILPVKAGLQGLGFVLPNLSSYLVNGHDKGELLTALSRQDTGPKLVIAETVKGKGVSFMEDNPEWHAKFPNAQEQLTIERELS